MNRFLHWAEYIRTRKPAPAHWGGTGAVPHYPNPADPHALMLPRVRAAFAALPASFDRGAYLGAPYNQGAEGSCVAFSWCGASSIDTNQYGGRWDTFDGHGLYHALGGFGDSGISSPACAQYLITNGTPKLAGGSEPVIGQYAMVPQQPQLFRQTIFACIVAGQSVKLALLLPEDFGWESGFGAETQGYHELLAFGYYTRADGKQFYKVFNTWGPWGLNGTGVGSILCDYCEANGNQQDLCYAETSVTSLAPTPPPTPVPPTPPTPPPPPPPAATRIAGDASGSGTLAVGASLGLSGAFVGQLAVAEVGPSPKPDPNPDPSPNPNPSPNPSPGGLTVTVLGKRHGESDVAIWATATGADGHFVTGTATGIAGSNILPPHVLDPRGDLTVWIVPLTTGSDIIINATATDGRTGQGHLMAP